MNREELNAIAQIYYENGNKTKAFDCFLESAQMGCRDAMYNLAICYHDGIGCRRDFDKTEFWLKKAALLGDLDAQKKLDERSEW